MFKLSPAAAHGRFLFENDIWQDIVLMTLENHHLDGNHITLRGTESINFGNVSYLGLDVDERLKEAAIRAIHKYGVQFSSSRGFVQLPLYEELETLLAQMFGRPVLVTPSTTLAHQAAMPLFMQKEDAVLVDYQAHASLQQTLEIVRSKKTEIVYVGHNDLVRLEQTLQELSPKYERVWYVADGVYSMFGDIAPLEHLSALLDKFPNLFLYLDDAHGMSWAGPQGTGMVCKKMPLHERMLLVTSLNKGFAAGGGAIVCPDEKIKHWLKRAGSSLVFSGPVQPSALAAGIASARIHLSPEIGQRQHKVLSNIRYFIETARKHGIHLADYSETPIFYVAVGKFKTGIRLCKDLREKGFFTNLGVYPAVPSNQTGLRISINYHQSMSDIYQLLSLISEMLPVYLAEDNFSPETMRHFFERKRHAHSHDMETVDA